MQSVHRNCHETSLGKSWRNFLEKSWLKSWLLELRYWQSWQSKQSTPCITSNPSACFSTLSVYKGFVKNSSFFYFNTFISIISLSENYWILEIFCNNSFLAIWKESPDEWQSPMYEWASFNQSLSKTTNGKFSDEFLFESNKSCKAFSFEIHFSFSMVFVWNILTSFKKNVAFLVWKGFV